MLDYEARIAEWLANDPGLRSASVNLARRTNGLEDIHPLRTWVITILFDLGYGVVVDDLNWITTHGGNVTEADRIRTELTSLTFSVANWDRVSRLLLAYTSKETA